MGSPADLSNDYSTILLREIGISLNRVLRFGTVQSAKDHYPMADDGWIDALKLQRLL